jgi:nitroimidazol reductase NimA-like FMN-containing flavoprotein (pyridoxamine 5'-phosphate oxidase superfamily)
MSPTGALLHSAIPDEEVAPIGFDQCGLEILSREECLRLLASAPVGRLSVTCGALPLVLPITFRLADERIFFRVVRGGTLDTATRNVVVGFEADEIDPRTLMGWSVVVVGVARDSLDPACAEELSAAGTPWARPGGEHRIVELSTEVVSGRRIIPHKPPAEAIG